VRIVVVAVGRLRPPFADDVQHYQKLIARHTLLHRDGEMLDSMAFSRFLEQRRQSGRDLCFVIGGPYGLELDAVDHRFSLGAITLPHQLARVVLLEQLYRAHKILAGEPYHY
jgi:23S rRNA (pseudouridine1915-N3)-methyltransferase